VAVAGLAKGGAGVKKAWNWGRQKFGSGTQAVAKMQGTDPIH
jgi:hypothetical protein